jgi:hypothetical protein
VLRVRVRANRPAIVTIEVRRNGRRILRLTRRLDAGTTTLRHRGRVVVPRRGTGRYRVSLSRIRPAPPR